jgi:hypothetical protein
MNDIPPARWDVDITATVHLPLRVTKIRRRSVDVSINGGPAVTLVKDEDMHLNIPYRGHRR